MVKAMTLGLALGLAAATARAEEAAAPAAAEEETKVLTFLRENRPEMAHHLEGAKRERPDEYRRHIGEMAKMVGNPEMREVFLKTSGAEAKVHKAAEAVRRAEGAEKDRLTKELEAALGDQFDAKLAQQELQVKKMTEEIGKLKARIEARRAKKAQLVKKRLADMTGEGDGMDW
ncbi:MAG: hypothetical protein FD126_80 [Elusimicrobia bacterium]|nr:MAG: hypothetical protein FD126_80 [Elusimicrobiota bacterium]